MLFTDNPVMRWLINVRDYGLEYTAKRFYSLYGGEVVDNGDTQQQGRIKLKTGVTGVGIRRPDGVLDPATICRQALPGSVYAGLDHGLYFPPEVGDSVWVSFDHGDPCHPRYHGSWWRNKDLTKSPIGSELPSEFKQTPGELAMPHPIRPFRRGIKTKFGHGLIFSDNDLAPYVAVWSGQQISPGVPALRKNQITLSDSPSGVDSINGQTANLGIHAHTFYGHKLELDDSRLSVTISGPTDPTGEISNSITIEDLVGRITIKTRDNQSVIIDDLAETITVTATGTLLVGAAGGISMASGLAPTVPPVPGVAVETGAGAKISIFTGLVTETCNGGFLQSVIGGFSQTVVGGFTQDVTGDLTISATGDLTISADGLLGIKTNAPAAEPVTPTISLGSSVNPADYYLVHKDFFTLFNTHTHTGLGGPPVIKALPPSNPAAPVPDPAILPHLDERLFITRHTKAN